jgi:hypothetical protein
MSTEKVREAILAGRIEYSDRAAEALANFDWDNPDHTIVSIELNGCWGPWHKTAKNGTPLGNNGGFDVWYTFKSAGCGRATIYKGDDGKLHCYNQGMRRKFIKELLARLVDEMEFDDEDSDRTAALGDFPSGDGAFI